MKLAKILYPCDFSTSEEAALETATALARAHGATLIILHVQEPAYAYGGGELYMGISEPGEEELRRMLDGVAPTDPSISFTRRMVRGEPAEAIVRTAEENDVDMIVMSTHGRSGLVRVLMGSVAEAVVRKAKCPVVTVRASAVRRAGTAAS